MAGAGAAPSWLERAVCAAGAPVKRKKVLVAIFQRGGADGLNMVVPHGEKAYYDLRPAIAIPRPTADPGKKDDAALDLDGFFGLHPSLGPLKPLFDQGHLAIVNAVGSPDPTRSHLDAQRYMEGWMNRARGRERAADLRRPYTPAAGACYPRGRFGESLRRIAQSIKSDVGVEMAWADIGGWDHHVNQAGRRPSEGALADLLREYGQGLRAFWTDMGDRMSDVVVVTVSEFGRTAGENGGRGTDHGHGNCMFAMGGGVGGGKVYGRWPGLEREQLREGRDLAVTTDFRDVVGELVSRHLGNQAVKAVFPGHDVKAVGLV
jgi:uncharacterized protein (DUF1501 family)